MSTSRAFERYHPSVQRWIYRRKWKALRAAQELSADAILGGERDVLVAAGTGQGKTEAAFFPLWSLLAEASGGGVRVLYVAPLKALINDQRVRQEDFCREQGIRVTAWHGDVPAAPKRKLVEDPAGVLLITPESLESMLVRHGHGVSRIFAPLTHVVIDELHAFFDTERGRQLQSLLARIEAVLARRVARIGLSATLGDDPEVAKEFLRPGDLGNVELVTVEDDDKELKLVVYGFEEPDNKPSLEDVPDGDEEDERDSVDVAMGAVRDRLYRTLGKGGSHLIFANRRSDVELLADMLRRRAELDGRPNAFFPHHGSLSKDQRESVEQRLKEQPTVAVCTSTLEMGIDIGAVESVAQVRCPPSVASMRQRLGRSGRGDDQPSVLRLCVTEREVSSKSDLTDRLRVELFQTVAMIDLMDRDRWCEPPRPARDHYSTLVQQILALMMQRGGVRADVAWRELCQTGAFRSVEAKPFGAILRSLAAAGLIQQMDDGTLLLSAKGEKITNHYSFYTVFQVSEEYRLMSRGKILGHLPVVAPLQVGSFLIFSGRRWRIADVDADKRVVELRPHRGGRPPMFEGGQGSLVHDRIRRRMRDLYIAADVPAYLDRKASQQLTEGARTFRDLDLTRRALLTEGPHVRWLPWRGDQVVNALYLWLTSERMGKRSTDGSNRPLQVHNDGVTLLVDRIGRDEFLSRLASSLDPEPPSASDLIAPVLNVGQERYDHLVPRELLEREYAARMLDVPAAVEEVRKLVAGIG